MNRMFFIAIFFFAAFVSAEEKNPYTNEVREYLKSLKNVTAEFTQQDKYGNVQKGVMYMSRPDKMRWEYQDPKEFIVIMDGTKIYYYDKELDQFSHYIGDPGMINLIAEEDIFLSKQLKLLNIESDSDLIRAHFMHTENNGRITFIFRPKPFVLLGFVVKEETSNKLFIKLHNLAIGKAIDPSLFVFKHSLAPKSQR